MRKRLPDKLPKKKPSDCLQCEHCKELTWFNRIVCDRAMVPVENCLTRKIECVKWKQKK